MPLTPTDIHNVVLGTAPLGRRGYDKEEVDAFLDAVTHEMIRLLEGNDVLRRRAGHADTAVPRLTLSGSATDAELSALTDELDRACEARDRAQQTNRILQVRLDDHHAAAGSAAEPHDTGTEDVLALAHRTADQHLQTAHRESHMLVTDARQHSERITDDARQMAHEIEQNAQRHHSDATAELQTRRTALAHEINELAEFATTYRTALEDHIHRQAQVHDVRPGDLSPAASPQGRPAGQSRQPG